MSSVFKIYSPEDCDFYYDGELQGHIEGNSKKAFRFEVERKGVYRLEFINSEYQTELMMKVSIDADEEREVELDFSEVNEPAIQERERIIIAIEHDYGLGERLPEEIISAISKNGIVTIPKGVRKIGYGAFWGYSSLTSITIPDSVTEIGYSAFAVCCSLTAFYGKYASEDSRCLIKDGRLLAFAPYDITKYTIPNGVTEIGYRAFCGCKSLTSITIPDSITVIKDNAFDGCFSLTAFYGKYASKDSRCLIKDGRLLAFTRYDITKYIIPNSVTEIGTAFCGRKNLTSIAIPDSVTDIRYNSFRGCYRLTAFYGKYASKDSRCWIKDGRLLAFAPYDITKYTIPNGVTEIGYGAFDDCLGLTSITIPDSVTIIGDFAFEHCTDLTSVYCKATIPPKLEGCCIFNASDLKIYVPKSEGSSVLEAYKSAESWKSYADVIEEYDFDNE